MPVLVVGLNFNAVSVGPEATSYEPGWNNFPPPDIENPWQDPMSYCSGYDFTPGKIGYWGNGDGRFLYPPSRDPEKDRTKHLTGPVDSVRWEILREGIEDYEYFKLLEKAVASAGGKLRARAAEARKLLAIPGSVFKSAEDYTKDPLVLLDYRRRVAEAIQALAPGLGARKGPQAP